MQQIIWTTMLLLVGVNGHAQDALLKAQERAKYLGDYKALLEHEDSTIRLAAIEEALLSNDALLRSMALETALDSDDDRLQTVAIRWYINERERIPVTLILPERATDGQKYIYQTWGSLILVKPKVTGQDEIEYSGVSYGAGGQLIRGGMEIRFNPGAGMGCTMTLKAAGGTTLAGQFFCNFGAGYGKRFGEDQNAIVARIDFS